MNTMSLVIAGRFRSLIGKLEPRPSEIDIYESHRRSATIRLNKAFGIRLVPTIGSYKRGSAIRRFSDIDLMPVFPIALIRWGSAWKTSTTILNQTRDQLRDRYTDTNVGRDNQAIVIRFRDGQHPVDVTPAVYTGPGLNNYPIYAIPDGEGWWKDSSPHIHNKFINDQNASSGGKLRNVVKLVKFWRYCRTPHIPINSFHVELLLAQERTCIGAKSYARCFTETLQLLADRQCRALRDPLRISGYVKAANTDVKRGVALGAIEASLNHAYRALDAENYGGLHEATRQWEMVFHGYFMGAAYPS
jgi:hypothetical protein